MTLLALDTATPMSSVALLREGSVVASLAVAGSRRHGEVLAPAVQQLLGLAELTPGELTAVAADVGPGLFTGLRVGLATAGALVSALGIPAVGVGSLEVLAHPHRHQQRLVAAVVDARRGEVFRAVYRPLGQGVLAEVLAPLAVAPDLLGDQLAELAEPVLAVGDGALRYGGQLGALLGDALLVAGPLDAYPRASVLAELAARRLGAGSGADARAQLRPRYLRQADVRIGWDRRDGAGVLGDA